MLTITLRNGLTIAAPELDLGDLVEAMAETDSLYMVLETVQGQCLINLEDVSCAEYQRAETEH